MSMLPLLPIGIQNTATPYFGPRLGFDNRPLDRRHQSTRRTACGSVTAPRIRRAPPQRSHTSTWIANTRRRSRPGPPSR